MTTPWLDVIGVTEAGIDALPPQTRALLEAAETVIGPKRLLPPEGTQNLVPWTAPLSAMLDQVMAARGSQTVILATGDPNWFGIGATLSKQLSPEEFNLHPAASSFQLAAARLHWPLQNVTTLSLHGRDAAALNPHILPGNRLLALTSDQSTLSEVTEILSRRGYAKSQLTVLENLGADTEEIVRFRADDTSGKILGNFFVLAVDCVADANAPLLSAVPGLPDEAYVSDGQLTKREVRAATLAKLAPFPDALLWDVGAGSGSVAIEWMRAARNAQAICFERDAARCHMIDHNRQTLGTPGLKIVMGEAPACLVGQPAPHAIFLGGDVGNEEIFEACLNALKPGGRLVANAVTLDGEQALHRRQKTFGGELARLDISVLDTIGGHSVMRPRMAVTQWAMIKDSAP